MTIRLNGSTSGYVEIDAPAVAGAGVLTLPTGTGTLATQAFVTADYLPIAGGKILQIVRATDTTTRSTTSTSFVDASLSVTITPQRSTSIILVVWTASTYVASTRFLYLQITDSSNVALSGAQGGGFGTAGSSLDGPQTIIGYATPGTTAATTYKGRFKVNAGSGGTIDNTQSTGQLIALEFSA